MNGGVISRACVMLFMNTKHAIKEILWLILERRAFRSNFSSEHWQKYINGLP